MQGKPTENGAAFSCGAPISYSEAATVLNRVLDLGDVELAVWYADREAMPSWAAQAVGNMEALNVLSAGSFGSDRLETAVTRADAARDALRRRGAAAGREKKRLAGLAAIKSGVRPPLRQRKKSSARRAGLVSHLRRNVHQFMLYFGGGLC